MDTSSPDLARIRWIPFANGAGEEIPGFALLRVTSTDSDGLITVGKPNEDSAQLLLVNGPTPVASGGRGDCTFDFPIHMLYDTGDGTPAVGEEWGSANGSWKLNSGKGGFLILGGATSGRVLAARAGGGGGGRTIDYYLQQGTDPIESWYIGSMPRIAGTVAVGSLNTTANQLVAFPIVVPHGGTADLIGMGVNSNPSVTALGRLGIYTNTADTKLEPADLVVDAGEVQLDATGAKTRSITEGLNAGELYWLAFTANEGGVAIYAVVFTYATNLLGYRNIGDSFNGGAPGYKVTRAYGALPDPFPSVSASDLWTEALSDFPLIGIRLS